MEILFFPTKLESFGYVIPEAMINGVIPVVSELRGITDQFITEGKNGFLCHPDQPNCFSRKISALLSNEDKINFSSNARIQIENNFSSLQFSEKYASVVITIKKANQMNLISSVLLCILHTASVVRFKIQTKLNYL
jgi:glycosyltransferase involved in cell wall biosynthesis